MFAVWVWVQALLGVFHGTLSVSYFKLLKKNEIIKNPSTHGFGIKKDRSLSVWPYTCCFMLFNFHFSTNWWNEMMVMTIEILIV